MCSVVLINSFHCSSIIIIIDAAVAAVCLTRSCIVLLLDLFTQWLSGEHLHHVITCEIIRSVS